MKRLSGGLSALAFAVALTGCVATNTTIAGYTDGPSKVNFTVVDARPVEDKQSETESFWGTSCNFGIYRMGDETSAPTRLEMLRQDIEFQIAAKVANTTLTVTRYRMYLNRMRITNWQNASRGLAGAMLTPTCGKADVKEGWYDTSETTNSISPFVVEIKASYRGKDYEVRAVSSPTLEIPAAGGFRNADQAPFVYGAIEKANLALIELIKHDLPAQ